MGKSRCQEILSQAKVWKMWEYWMYFPFFKLNDWGKRSDSCRRRLIQRFLTVSNSRSPSSRKASRV